VTTPLVAAACGVSVDGQCLPPAQCPEAPVTTSPDQVVGACNTYANQQASSAGAAAGVTVTDTGYLEYPVTAAQVAAGTYEPPLTYQVQKNQEMVTLQPQVAQHLASFAAAGAATGLRQNSNSGNEYPAFSLSGYQLSHQEDGKCGPQSSALILQWDFNGSGTTAPNQGQMASEEQWDYSQGVWWKDVTGPLDNHMNSVFGYPWYIVYSPGNNAANNILSQVVDDVYYHNFAVMAGVNPNGYLNWRQYHYTSKMGHYLTVDGYDEYSGGHILIADPYYSPDYADKPYGFWTLTLAEYAGGVQHQWW
jgi:hypothetical protein